MMWTCRELSWIGTNQVKLTVRLTIGQVTRTVSQPRRSGGPLRQVSAKARQMLAKERKGAPIG